MIFDASRQVLWFGRAALLIVAAAVAVAAPPTNPQPDATMPNVFYGAVPPDGTAAPVLVFIHGLGANAEWWWKSNDNMYTAVYEGGYRSAFISMSPDNSRNDSGIIKNAAVLKAALPKVAAHYNVPQFYVVCHSMGGVDLQAALLKSQLTQLDTDIAKYVKAVFTLATPNQGTELADWAFGTGKPLAEKLGLTSAGLFDLQTTFMAGFRTKSRPGLRRRRDSLLHHGGDGIHQQHPAPGDRQHFEYSC